MKPGNRDARGTGRGPVDPTQEIAAVDILDDSPIDVDIPIELEAETGADSSQVTGHSISPLALSIAPPPPRRTADSTYKIALTPPRRRLGGVVMAVMGVSACILLAAAVRASGSDSANGNVAEATQGSVSASLPPVVGAAAAGQANAASQVSAPTSGTIVSRAASLFVDGTKLSASSAIVTCGHHTVRAGRAKARNVVVPCGGTLEIDRKGTPRASK